MDLLGRTLPVQGSATSAYSGAGRSCLHTGLTVPPPPPPPPGEDGFWMWVEDDVEIHGGVPAPPSMVPAPLPLRLPVGGPALRPLSPDIPLSSTFIAPFTSCAAPGRCITPSPPRSGYTAPSRLTVDRFEARYSTPPRVPEQHQITVPSSTGGSGPLAASRISVAARPTQKVLERTGSTLSCSGQPCPGRQRSGLSEQSENETHPWMHPPNFSRESDREQVLGVVRQVPSSAPLPPGLHVSQQQRFPTLPPDSVDPLMQAQHHSPLEDVPFSGAAATQCLACGSIAPVYSSNILPQRPLDEEPWLPPSMHLNPFTGVACQRSMGKAVPTTLLDSSTFSSVWNPSTGGSIAPAVATQPLRSPSGTGTVTWQASSDPSMPSTAPSYGHSGGSANSDRLMYDIGAFPSQKWSILSSPHPWLTSTKSDMSGVFKQWEPYAEEAAMTVNVGTVHQFDSVMLPS